LVDYKYFQINFKFGFNSSVIVFNSELIENSSRSFWIKVGKSWVFIGVFKIYFVGCPWYNVPVKCSLGNLIEYGQNTSLSLLGSNICIQYRCVGFISVTESGTQYSLVWSNLSVINWRTESEYYISYFQIGTWTWITGPFRDACISLVVILSLILILFLHIRDFFNSWIPILMIHWYKTTILLKNVIREIHNHKTIYTYIQLNTWWNCGWNLNYKRAWQTDEVAFRRQNIISVSLRT
jgi:hypothetical protein